MQSKYSPEQIERTFERVTNMITGSVEVDIEYRGMDQKSIRIDVLNASGRNNVQYKCFCTISPEYNSAPYLERSVGYVGAIYENENDNIIFLISGCEFPRIRINWMLVE